MKAQFAIFPIFLTGLNLLKGLYKHVKLQKVILKGNHFYDITCEMSCTQSIHLSSPRISLSAFCFVVFW